MNVDPTRVEWFGSIENKDPKNQDLRPKTHTKTKTHMKTKTYTKTKTHTKTKTPIKTKLEINLAF